jgi:uncharacterized membrane protein
VPVRPAIRWALGIAAGAAVVHLAAVVAIPRVIMGLVLRGIAARAGENRCFHPPLATAEARDIVRPSPDFAYTAAVFDVRERPLRVVVPLTAPYTSLSGFASNTDNFFAVNDLDAGGPEIDVVVVGPSTPRAGLEGLRLAVSPSDRGVLLVRRVVPDAASFAAVDAARQRTRCALR